ncbi:hypothetical protein JTE90_015498 [Oedothorax gibbosus]|uniref:Uncharacterized protein n=1 Tax=Oedothorax gibbosus TaxID=931172 RepID=A0AAV6VRH1_9ARAC|nr:hypothetical protein JTE90_015498 [Oedothorax gibbosus]
MTPAVFSPYPSFTRCEKYNHTPSIIHSIISVQVPQGYAKTPTAFPYPPYLTPPSQNKGALGISDDWGEGDGQKRLTTS